MSYATLQNMKDRFGSDELIQLTDKEFPKTGEIVKTVLDKAFADAEVEINGYLTGRYALPFADPPKILEVIACDIARYRLSLGGHMPEMVEKAYKNAIDSLTKIAKGTVQLGVAPTQAPPASSGGPTVSAPPRVFTDETLKDYQ